MAVNDKDPSVVYSTAPEDFYYMDVNVPCQGACPAATNIPAYIRCLHEERFGRSYEVNRFANILPAVLGRICSRPCEDKCRHGESELGESVNICHLKRAAADLQAGAPPALILPQKSLNKKVAIIGSGPAGLAAAHDLAAAGFTVTIYEAFAEAGGMLRYGIPEFRLPRQIIDEEINRILALGITLKTEVRVGVDISIAALNAESDAVLLAAGCYEANKLKVPGEELAGVYAGLDFMIDVCTGKAPDPGRKVLVLGAGFTAFDCARSALRLGAEDVRICLRRTEKDLSVTHDEVLEAKKEGVRIESLRQGVRVIGDDKVLGVEFIRNLPGDLRADGKREISAIADSEFSMLADSVIVATGQQTRPIEGDKVPVADGDSILSSIPGLYLAGDYLTGPATVIDAIAGGRKAANKICEDLLSKPIWEKYVRMEECEITDRKRAWDFIPRQAMPTIMPPATRLAAIDLEIENGYDKQLTAEEAKRCYLCYQHYEIDLSRCIYCRYCIDSAPRDCIKMVKKVDTNEAGAIVGLQETSEWRQVNAIVIDNARCIRCGECVRVCPVDCISVSRVELVEDIIRPEVRHG